MDTNLLLKWLDLPAGPWPPPDRVLLGLPDGKIDPAAAELRALELMEKLRPHQLVQPDLVTEGMNRLAQALIAATAAPPPPVLPFFPDVSIEPEAPPPPKVVPRKKPAPAPKILDAEIVRPAKPKIVDAEVVAFSPAKSTTGSMPALQLPPEPPAEPLSLPPAEPPVAPEVVAAPADRRQAYRELAALRNLRRAWDGVRLSLGVAGQGFRTPAEVCDFFEAVPRIRAALRHPHLPPLDPQSPGRAVRAVVGHPLPLGVVRSLIPTQRQSLAWDWAAGEAALRQRSAAIRRGLALRRPPVPVRKRLAATRAWAGRNPEWLLAVASVGVVVAAVVRLTGE